MSVDVTSRHMNLSQGMQDYAREKAEELQEMFPRLEHVHIILDHEKRMRIAEVDARARNHIHVESKESSENMRVSIDVAVERAARQLRKLRDKIQDHKTTMKLAQAERSITGV